MSITDAIYARRYPDEAGIPKHLRRAFHERITLTFDALEAEMEAHDADTLRLVDGEWRMYRAEDAEPWHNPDDLHVLVPVEVD